MVAAAAQAAGGTGEAESTCPVTRVRERAGLRWQDGVCAMEPKRLAAKPNPAWERNRIRCCGGLHEQKHALGDACTGKL